MPARPADAGPIETLCPRPGHARASFVLTGDPHMRFFMTSILVSSFVAATLIGCGEKKAAPASETPAAAEEKKADETKAEDKKAEAPKEEAEKAEAEKAEAPKAAAPAAAAPAEAKASAEDCKAACENMTKILMDSMPADLPPEVKAEAQKQLASCPAQCQAQSTPAQAKCIGAAKSPADMEKCAGGK